MPPDPSSSRIEILEGVGVHTGEPSRIELIRRTDSSSGPLPGIRFYLPGQSAPMGMDSLSTLPRHANRATLLGSHGDAGGILLHTPEHLFAALLLFAECPLDIRFGAAELPILDGSARPFRDALARLFPERSPAPAWREQPSQLAWEHAWPGGHIKVKPAARFSVTCILSRPSLEETYRLASADQAWREILPARTFIFHQEWLQARAAGMLKGATVDSGLLLAGSPEEHGLLGGLHPEWAAGPYPLLNQEAWRMPGEAVRHKVLDLLGDLALSGLALPGIDVEIRNGGHAVHHLLLDKLAKQRPAEPGPDSRG